MLRFLRKPLYTLLIALLILSNLRCKKDTDLDPTSIRLTRVEYYGYLYNNIQNRYLLAYDDLTYDSKGRLEAKRSYDKIYNKSNVNSNDFRRQSYELKYGVDGNINQIIQTNSDSSQITATYAWVGNTVSVNATFPNGSKSAFLLGLNDDKLPVRKTTRTYTSRAEYDAKGNVIKLFSDAPIDIWFQGVEYDSTKFDPNSTSYELRMFSCLTSYSDLNFPPVSRNWLLKFTYDTPTSIYDNSIIFSSIEFNKLGYLTKTIPMNNNNNITQYYYSNK